MNEARAPLTSNITDLRPDGKPSKRNAPFDWLAAPAYLVVQKHALDPRAPLSSSARLLALAIASVLGGKDERDAGFATLDTLAKRTKLSRSTVKRARRELDQDAPFPLFEMRLGGVTRGIRHGCFRFHVVRDPARYRADKIRKAVREVGARASLSEADEPSREEARLEHRRQLMLAVARGEITPEVYVREIGKLSRAAAGKQGRR